MVAIVYDDACVSQLPVNQRYMLPKNYIATIVEHEDILVNREVMLIAQVAVISIFSGGDVEKWQR